MKKHNVCRNISEGHEFLIQAAWSNNWLSACETFTQPPYSFGSLSFQREIFRADNYLRASRPSVDGVTASLRLLCIDT